MSNNEAKQCQHYVVAEYMRINSFQEFACTACGELLALRPVSDHAQDAGRWRQVGSTNAPMTIHSPDNASWLVYGGESLLRRLNALEAQAALVPKLVATLRETLRIIDDLEDHNAVMDDVTGVVTRATKVLREARGEPVEEQVR